MGRNDYRKTPDARCTPAAIKAVCKLMRAGEWRNEAAIRAGVSPSALKSWVAAGRREPAGQFGWVAVEIDKARADRTAKLIAKIQASDDFRAATLQLERLDPKRFHLALRVMIDGGMTEMVAAVKRVVEKRVPDATDRAAWLAEITAELARGEGGGDVGDGDDGGAEG